MDSSAEYFDGEVATTTETVAYVTVDDMQVMTNVGYGMSIMGAGMLLSFTVAWIISLLRRS